MCWPGPPGCALAARSSQWWPGACPSRCKRGIRLRLSSSHARVCHSEPQAKNPRPSEGTSLPQHDMSDSSVRNVLLVALTFVAGAVDATSYLGLGRVFTANMTGNMILLGLGAGRIQGLDVLRSGTAFLGFAVGVAIGAHILGRTASPEIWHRRVTVALGIETVLLGAFAVGWLWMSAEPQRPWLEALIAFSAGAMGIQSAAAPRLAVASVSTTFVTGTLTS